MNDAIHAINVGATYFLEQQLWPLVWQSSLLIILVALCNRTLFRRAAPQFRYALWGLVLLRLVVPPQLDLPTGVSHWAMPVVSEHAAPLLPANIPTPENSKGAPAPSPVVPVLSSASTAAENAPLSTTQAPPPVSIALPTVALGLWAVGAVLLLALLLAQVRRHRRMLRQSQPPPEWINEAVASYRKTLGIRWPVRLCVVQDTTSPALLGLFRPTLLLPQSTLNRLDTDQIKAVLAHELAHVKRCDFLVNWVQVLLGIVYFFHPLVWFANREMRREREQACDDLTLVALGLNRTGYAESLLRVAEDLVAHRRFAPVHVGVFESERELTTRLKRILDARKRPVPRLTALSATAVVIFAALFGTWHASDAAPEAKDAVTEATDGSTENAPTVEMRSVVATVTDSKGNPVEGAELSAFYLRTDANPGASYIWRTEFGPASAPPTDASGETRVPYPRYVAEGMETSKVGVKVHHPDFASVDRVELNVDGTSPPIKMEPGGIIQVSGHLPTNPEPVDMPHALLYGTTRNSWTVRRGGILERRDLQPGEHSVMLAYEDADGTMYFSTPKEFNARPGETVSFKFQLYTGGNLTGNLDPSIPRPVEAGWAEVRIRPEHLVGPTNSRPGSLEWNSTVPVNADGTFEFDGLPKGHAELIAGCKGAISDGERPDGHATTGFPATTTLDGLDDHVEIPMIRTATARIQLKDPDGNPVPDAKVIFSPNVRFFGFYNTVIGPSAVSTLEAQSMTSAELTTVWQDREPRYSSVSDGRGLVTITNLPPWRDFFDIKSDTHDLPANERTRRSHAINLNPGETTELTVELVPKGTATLGDKTAEGPKPTPEALPAALNRQREEAAPPDEEMDEPDPFAVPTTPTADKKHLEGIVVDEAGKPIEGVLVDAWTHYTGTETKTDERGHFTLNNMSVRHGELEVRFSKDGFAPVYMYRQPAGILKAPVVMNSRTFITGIVRDHRGDPVSDVSIHADGGRRDAAGSKRVIDWAYGAQAETSSDPSGHYRLWVQEGDYTLTATHGYESATLATTVARHESKQLDIQLEIAPIFRARILDATTEKPVSGLRVVHRRRSGPSFEGRTDKNGLVNIEGIFRGKWAFDACDSTMNVTRNWSPQASDPRDNYSFNDKTQWQRNFNSLSFSVHHNMEPVTIYVERGAMVQGTVLDPDGNPVAGATVAPALTGTGNSLTGDTRFRTKTNDTGRFEVLQPASNGRKYNLIARAPSGAEGRRWANGTSGLLVTEPGDTVEDVVIRLQPPCTIRGKAVDAEGNPVAGREVRAMSTAKDDNRYYVPTSRTKNDGTFEIPFVAPGEHFVQVAPFWLDPEEAPEGTSQIVTVTPAQPAEGASLVAKPD